MVDQGGFRSQSKVDLVATVATSPVVASSAVETCPSIKLVFDRLVTHIYFILFLKENGLII